MSLSARLLPLALMALVACSSGGGDGTPDAGGDGLPPDFCNTREEALTAAECQLTAGQEVEQHISTAGDQDWYSLTLPANAGPRTLVRVTAGYKAQSTAVSLAVSLLQEDGKSLERKVDNHGQGAPQPVEMLVPHGSPNARVLVLVSDAALVPSRPAFDARSKYFLKVEVLENPDSNEPNDTAAQATPVTLTPQNNISTGTATGYIATTGDVDHFSFDVPANKVLYVHLTGPMLEPPPAYRLSYVLLRPDGTAESEDNMRPKVVPADLATARRVTAAGKWTVVVQGYMASTDKEKPPGDLRQQYTLEVRVMDEEDTFDKTTPNDTYDKAFWRDLGSTPGAAASTSFTGRLGSAGDKDWYAVTLGADTRPTLLRYRLEPLGSGGRFAPLPGLVDRQLRVLTPVPGGAISTQQLNCMTRSDICPKGYGENPSAQALVEGYCTAQSALNRPPLCLHSGREEAQQGFTGLHNFQGAIPVPGHGATVVYYFLVQDDGNDWADDRDYRLTVSWLTDSDEEARFQGGSVELPEPAVLEQDLSATSFPAPPADPKYEVDGELTHGYGRLRGNDRLTGRGVRGPDDYDAVPSDVDTFEFTLPGAPADGPADQTWELQWVVQHLPDGGLPHQLTLDLEFCDGEQLDGGACTPVTTGSRGAPLTLAWRADPLRAWHSEGSTLSGLQPLYGISSGGGATTVTVQPYACGCLEPRFIQGGKMKVAVSASERTDYEPVRYSLRTAYTDYPKSYAVDAGITAQCPAPVQDGGILLDDGGTQPVYAPGCQFTLQP